MEIRFYKTKSPANSINKELTDETIKDCKLKADFNLMNPVIMLAENVIDFNYCYIPAFKRYYFIRNYEVIANKLAELTLLEDVLETWKADILASQCTLREQENFNHYYNSDFKNEVRKEVEKFESDTKLSYTENIIMVTLGG